MVTVGSGRYTYEFVPGWGKLPPGYAFGMIPGMAVDKHDKIYIFSRNPNHVYIFDRDGKFLSMWDKSIFADYSIHSPHGFYIGPDEKVYLTDSRDHTVRKFTLDGKLLMTLGTEGKPGEEGEPFNRPASAAISSSGDIFIADGYGNARVHKYSPEGKLLKSWGKPGTGPSEFNLPHGIWIDKDDHVWVADRENNRIQIFTVEGKYLKQLTDFVRPGTVYIDNEDTVYVPEVFGRMSVLDLDGRLLARWGGEKSYVLDCVSRVKGDFIPYSDLLKWYKTPGKFCDSHSCCVDSRGDLYVGEVAGGQRIQKFVRKK